MQHDEDAIDDIYEKHEESINYVGGKGMFDYSAKQAMREYCELIARTSDERIAELESALKVAHGHAERSMNTITFMCKGPHGASPELLKYAMDSAIANCQYDPHPLLTKES